MAFKENVTFVPVCRKFTVVDGSLPKVVFIPPNSQSKNALVCDNYYPKRS